MLDREASMEAKKRLDAVAKPVGSLGQFERIIIKIAGMTGTADIDLKKRAVAVFCASNGIVAEGVSSSGNEVTRIVSDNVAAGKSSINAMARTQKADVFMIDMGIDRPTRNFENEPAMTPDEARKAVNKGIMWAQDLKNEGYSIIATGEVGMGNTTTATAVICALLGLPVGYMVGTGAGIDNEQRTRKRNVIQDAIGRYGLLGADPLKVLSCVGGYDIAGMTGMFLGGVKCRMPIIIDGEISAAAALLASMMSKEAADFMIASHLSREPAAAAAMKRLNIDPVLHADMALGEGTGAVLMFGLLDAALAIYNETATYADLGLN